MKSTYKNWREQRGYAGKSVNEQMFRAGRVEEYYGDLDEHFDHEQLRSVINELKYSSEEERSRKPNPSMIPFNGNTRNNLASYRNATERYCKFRRETVDDEDIASISSFPMKDAENDINEQGQLIGLERDMQTALRRAKEQLELGLEIVDDGAERSVSSGFIDITAKDTRGSIVVIELKTGTARQKAVGQILGYMGDIADEEPDAEVRGILVAGDFDKKVRAAARVVPTLSHREYKVSFEFRNADETCELQGTDVEFLSSGTMKDFAAAKCAQNEFHNFTPPRRTRLRGSGRRPSSPVRCRGFRLH